jgi:hypothetical protein
MKRREFIGVAAAGAAGLALPVSAGTREPAPPGALAVPHLPGAIGVDEIGRLYRRKFPAEDSIDAVSEALRADLQLDLEATNASELATGLQDCVRRDFAHGRTVTLDGWVLSATEARQCALHSLLAL